MISMTKDLLKGLSSKIKTIRTKLEIWDIKKKKQSLGGKKTQCFLRLY